MTTLAELAAKYGFQSEELAAFLDLGAVEGDYTFSTENEAEYRHVLDNTVEGIYVDPLESPEL